MRIPWLERRMTAAEERSLSLHHRLLLVPELLPERSTATTVQVSVPAEV